MWKGKDGGNDDDAKDSGSYVVVNGSCIFESMMPVSQSS